MKHHYLVAVPTHGTVFSKHYLSSWGKPRIAHISQERPDNWLGRQDSNLQYMSLATKVGTAPTYACTSHVLLLNDSVKVMCVTITPRPNVYKKASHLCGISRIISTRLCRSMLYAVYHLYNGRFYMFLHANARHLCGLSFWSYWRCQCRPGTGYWTRTNDLLLRRQLRYPSALILHVCSQFHIFPVCVILHY